MKIPLPLRGLVFLLLVPLLLSSGGYRILGEDNSLHGEIRSGPHPPVPIEHMLDPLSFMEVPPLRTDNDIQSIQDPIPSTGDQRLLVILVDFPDREGSFTLQEWQQYFFGFGGFAHYFSEVSYGNLRYNGDIVGMLNGAPISISSSIAYVRLQQNITYYADELYGFGANFPQNNAGVVFDALSLLDDSGFDYGPYADPKNGHVENLVVIFAGSNYGYTNDPHNSLEATAFSLTAGGMAGGFVSSGGEILDNFTFCPEKHGEAEGEIARLGVCVHEQGHAMGMFDLYDRSGETTGTGRFDLMSYGGYGADNDGARPFHPSVLSKVKLGWADPTEILAGYRIVRLSPAENQANFYKIYPRGDINSGEYFLLENRQPFGFDTAWQDAGLCPGLLIWHIDEGIIQDYALVNRVNSRGTEPDYPPHPGVIVIEADGRYDMINTVNFGECSDTWQQFSIWHDLSIPAARLWDRSASRISVTVLDQVGYDLILAIGIEDPQFNYKKFLPAVEK